jgi:PKD repeat protein
MILLHKLALAIVLMGLLVMLLPISVAVADDVVNFPDQNLETFYNLTSLTAQNFALTVDASAVSCCTVKVNGKEITYFPWTQWYDRGTSITLEASGGACCQSGNWTIYTLGFSNTYPQSTVHFYMQSNINAVVVVSCSPKLPVASFAYSPQNPKVGEEITFDASSSCDPDGQIVSYNWHFGDGNTAEGDIATHAYSQVGAYTITLTVVDNEGLQDSTTQLIIFEEENQPPVASFKSWNIEDIGTNEPARIEGHHIVGGQIEFDASESTDPSGGTLTYYWDFGDGIQEVTSNPVYIKVFDKPEKVTVTLIVKNDKGIPSTNSSSEELDLSLKPGDLIVIRSGWPYANIFDFFGLRYTHVGIYVGMIDGEYRVVEATISSPPLSNKIGVQETHIERWGYPYEKYVDVVRVTDNPEIATRAVAFARGLALDPHPHFYDTDVWEKQIDCSHTGGPCPYCLCDKYYCSELVWAAYYTASNGTIDLSPKTNTTRLVAVSPDDIINYPASTSVGYHREEYPHKKAGMLSISALCPIDISVTDPSGLVITKESSQIPDAAYVETDLNEDNDIDNLVIIPEPKAGDYSIQVIPEPSALPEDTYSLHVAVGEEYIVLANNVPISEIPEGGYAIRSTEGGINAVPIAEANGPYIGAKGASIAFDSSGSYDPDGTISSYIWDFGDGSGGTGASLIHVYNCPGVYTITLSVIDDDGDVDTDTAKVTVTPQSMKSFVIKNLAIQWAPHRPGWQGSDAFSIFGRLQLPQGYTWASLEKQAIVTISIADKSGNDTVVFKGKLFGKPQSTIWSYRGSEQPPGEGMNINNMVIWWTPQGANWNGWAGFYIGGKLQLPEDVGVNTKPSDVKVTIEIPVTTAAGCGSLMGEQTVTCSVFKLANLWFYNAWPNLPTFPWDPTGKE